MRTKSEKLIDPNIQGKMEEAEFLFLECAIACPGNSDNWENLAVALMRAGNYNRAGMVRSYPCTLIQSPHPNQPRTPGLGRAGGSGVAYDSAATVLRTALRLAKRDGRTKDIESIRFHRKLVEENRR